MYMVVTCLSYCFFSVHAAEGSRIAEGSMTDNRYEIACVIQGEGYTKGYALGRRLPISHPQDLSTLTTRGVTAAVRGTRTKMKLLCTA